MRMIVSVRGLRAVVFCLIAAIALAGCSTARLYVDPTLPMFSELDLAHPAQTHPVKVVFEFRTNHRMNPGVTARLRPRIVAIVNQSGLFSGISNTAGNDIGELKLVIDNAALTDNAATKGMESGLTMGIASSTVTDGYVCTASYTWHGRAVQTTVRHALHTTLGNEPGPPGQEPKERVVAIHWVIDQIMWNALKNFSDQKAFE